MISDINDRLGKKNIIQAVINRIYPLNQDLQSTTCSEKKKKNRQKKDVDMKLSKAPATNGFPSRNHFIFAATIIRIVNYWIFF